MRAPKKTSQGNYDLILLPDKFYHCLGQVTYYKKIKAGGQIINIDHIYLIVQMTGEDFCPSLVC
jgi:hypothetical protein